MVQSTNTFSEMENGDWFSHMGPVNVLLGSFVFTTRAGDAVPLDQGRTIFFSWVFGLSLSLFPNKLMPPPPAPRLSMTSRDHPMGGLRRLDPSFISTLKRAKKGMTQGARLSVLSYRLLPNRMLILEILSASILGKTMLVGKHRPLNRCELRRGIA